MRSLKINVRKKLGEMERERKVSSSRDGISDILF